MKKLFTTILLSAAAALSCFAQSEEKVRPSYSVNTVRKCSVIDIEGSKHYDVTMEFKSCAFSAEHPYVNVTIKNQDGKKVLSKKYKESFLYIFKSGQVEVGKPNFPKIVVAPTSEKGVYQAAIREKEGIY